MKYKKGFTLSEIICYILLLSMIGLFMAYVINSYNKKISIEKKYDLCQREIEIVIDSITDKLIKSSLYTNYFYENNENGWCFYSDIEGDLVRFNRIEKKLWCRDYIELLYVEDIILSEYDYLKLIIKTEIFSFDFIIGGIDEYEKKNRN